MPRPLVADHPYRVFLESHTSNFAARKTARGRLAKIDERMEGIDLRGALRRGQRRGFLFETLASRRPGHDSSPMDHVANDLVFVANGVHQLRLPAECFAPAAGGQPRLALCQASLIECDWPSVRRQAAAWEKDAGRQPALLVALAKRHEQDGEYSAAVRCLKTAVRIAAQESTCNNLARIYWKQGQKEQCIATLEELLQTPDTGLAHARVRQAIAVSLMRDDRWSRALPYAEEAAKTGTAWALLTAAGCQEGMQNWDAADRCLRSVAVSYVDSPADWYFFCRRTGHGDLASRGRPPAMPSTNMTPAPPTGSLAMAYARAAGPYYLLEEEFDKAKRHFEKAFAKTKNPHQGLHLALLADRMKDAAKHNAVLQQVRNEGSSFIREATGKPTRN